MNISVVVSDVWAPLFVSYVHMHVQECVCTLSDDAFFARSDVLFFQWNVRMGDSGGIRLPNYILRSNTPAVAPNTPNT